MNKIKYLLILILIIICLPITVLGAEGITLEVDKTNLNVGDEITVSANVPSDLDAYALMATLKYDKNVFQAIDDSNFAKKDVSSILYSKETNKFGIVNKTGKISTGGTLFTVKLKVKDDANVGDTNIALTNISYSDGNGKKTLDMVSTKVFVSRDAKEGEMIPSNTENVITEDIEKDITVPTNTPIIITLCVVISVLLFAILYIVLKRKKTKIVYVLIGLEVLAIIATSILIIKNINKNDVNKDGVRDYADAEEIIKYLISIEGTEENTDIPSEDSNSSTDNTVNNESQTNNSSNTNSSSKNSSNKKSTTNSKKNTSTNKTNQSSANNNDNKNNGNDTDKKKNQTNPANSNTNPNTDDNANTNTNTNTNQNTNTNTNNTTNDNTVNDNENPEPNPPDEDKKPDYDTDNDGDIDIDDAGHTTEDTTNKTKVTLKKSNKENSIYCQKGEIILEFMAEVTPEDVKVARVKINDKYYDVESSEGIYFVEIGNLEDAGKYTFNITEVILDNGKNVETNFKIEKEILKDVPYINKFDLNDQNGTLSFDLIDEDEAFINGTVYIRNDGKVLKSKQVEAKDTTIVEDIPIIEDKTYLIEIAGKYDLDSDKESKENLYNQTMFSHSFMIGGDYNFELTDASITDAVKPGETVVLNFKSSNTRNKIIDNVNITNDGKPLSNCEAKKLTDDNYEIELIGADVTPGDHTVSLDSVNMETLKSFTNNQDYKVNTLTYTVLKNPPKIEGLKVSNSSEDKKINVEFKLNDETQATKKLTVALVDSADRIAGTKEIAMEDAINGQTIKTDVAYNNNTDGRFKVKVLADYELSDKYVYTDESLGEAEILTHSEEDISIINMYVVDNRNNKIDSYATKGQKDYQILFEVQVSQKIQDLAVANHGGGRAYGRLAAVNINGLNYPTSQITGLKSKVYLTAPEDAGVIKLKANRVELASDGYYKIFNDYFSVQEKSIEIEVLKDKPKVENLVVSEDYEKGSATFDFDVTLDETETPDGFKDGTIELNGETEAIHSGNNSVTFENIEKDKIFDLVFKGSFDLDTDALNNEEQPDKNETTNGEIYRVKYGLYNEDTYKNIKLEDCRVLSKKNNKYFEKNEKINLNFKITGIDNDAGILVESVIIDNKKYNISKKEDTYSLSLDGYSSSGEKQIKVTGIVLNNGKEVTLDIPYTFELEVLKDIIKIDNYNYKDLGNSLQVLSTLKDADNSIIGKAKIEIKDENDKILYNNDYEEKISFNKEKDSLRYYIKVTSDYDRDIDKDKNSENYRDNVVILDELISLDENKIELKDITDINLYKIEEKDGYEEINLKDTVNVEDIKNHKDKYFVEIKMDSLPTVQARIKEVVEGEALILVLDFDFVTLEDSNTNQNIRIQYGTIKNGEAKNEYHPSDAFRFLLEELNSGNDVTLTKNYDASSLSVDGNTYVTNDYAGKLDGNGFTIKNLTKPLFNKITGEVQNLNIVNVTLGAEGHAALANTTEGATIKHILIDKFNKNGSNGAGNGSLIGTASNTTVEECRSINVRLQAAGGEQQNGTFIGCTSNSTTVKNCYSQGAMLGGWNYTNAFIGNALSSNIINNCVKVTSNNERFADAYNNRLTTYENNISIGTNNFVGLYKELKNNYLYSPSENKNEVEGVTNITKEEITDSLFKERANFDESIWKIDNISYENLPIFNIEVKEDEHSNVTDYDKSKENLYNNLEKLMPFYNIEKIVDTAKSVKDTNLLNKEIQYILPVDKNGGIVTYITTSDYKKLNKIKIIFTDGSKCEYDVTYDRMYDMIASYRINDLGIDYSYDRYVVDSDSQLVNNIVNYLKSLDYTTNLDILTTNSSSRLYKDFYNETTKNELKDFVLKYISNSDYTSTTNDQSINNYIEKQLKKDKRIEKVLYTYNYFRRFYDLDVDGMKIYDFIMFNMDCFDNSLTPEKIADLYLGDKTGNNFNTGSTNSSYKAILSSYTKLDTVPKFVEYVVTKFSDHEMSEWTHNQFKGIITEFGVDGHPEVKYTLWDHFISTNNDEILKQFLPMLTLPETAAYVISSPVQYAIGAQRTYMQNPNDPAEVEKFMEKLGTYTTRMKRYFETLYAILGDENILNNALIYHIDKRLTKTETGGSVYNTQLTTTEPFHKNFVEATGLWAAAAGVNAAAWGPRLEWQAAGILDSTLAPEGENDTSHVTFRTWSHESAHLIDAKVFFKDNGRRFDAGGEDYADSFFMQSFGEFGIVMNLSMRFNDDVKVGNNLTVDRINSKQNIQDFYRKVFETIYMMDYIEAQAFLQLDLETQKALAVQASYPNEDKLLPNGKTYAEDDYAKYRARETTKYTRLNALEDFNVEFKTINDLIDNRILLIPGAVSESSMGSNRYGGEGFDRVHWYQPNNPDGRPDSYSLKWISYEMLGYKGYDDGLVEYASNIHYEPHKIYNNFETLSIGDANYKTDQMALEKITDGEFSNFSDYKEARFAEVQTNLEKLDNSINVKAYVQKFYDALVEDAKVVSDKTELKKSSAVRSEIYYTLKNKTNDFRDEIYKTTKQQDVSNLEVTK